MRADPQILHRLRWLAPALLLGALGGCALFMPKLVTPQLTVLSVHVQRADFWQQHLVVRLRVRNPNSIRLPVRALTYTLAVNGQPVAAGRCAQSFTVPAHSSADFNTDVTANMAGALLAVLGDGRRQPLHYRLRGKVELAHGLLRDLPFDESGQVTLK
jgi:LEA14-like dessication related protein